MLQPELQEFLGYVIGQLVDYPEDMVLVKTKGDPKRSVFKVRLRQSDVGKVIGKQGHTIVALRNLISAAAARHGERAALEIVEEDGERSERS